MNRKICVALLTILTFHETLLPAADDPNEPLKRRIGTWVTKTTFKKAEWTPEERTVAGNETIKWVLDKKFIQGTAKMNADGVQNLWLMNYDEEAKVYRMWYFDNKNSFPRGSNIGRWDAKTKTMKWFSETGDGFRGRGSWKYLNEDHFEWSMSIQDRDGKLMMDIHGEIKRKK